MTLRTVEFTDAYGILVKVSTDDSYPTLVAYDLDHKSIDVDQLLADPMATKRLIGALIEELDILNTAINNPITHDFIQGVEIEIPHQERRWGADSDAGKLHSDWYWLIAHLAGKALNAAGSNDMEKAKHHAITTAAALGNWFNAMSGEGTMRPGTTQ